MINAMKEMMFAEVPRALPVFIDEDVLNCVGKDTNEFATLYNGQQFVFDIVTCT